MAAARLVQQGERILVVGGPGITEAIEARGAIAIANTGDDHGPVDAVVAGIDRAIDYRRLTIASRAVRNGARFIATNDDATYPTPEGLAPGAGALIAPIAVASGITPVVAGKPNRPMGDVIEERVGGALAGAAVVVGDRPESDGAFAETLGIPFALVRSGVTSLSEPRPHAVPVAFDCQDFAAFATLLTGP
jgi:4-nitrophenyl phosphatase